MKIAIIYNKDLTGVINTLGMQNKEFYSEANVKRVAESLEKAGHNVHILDGNMYIIERLQHFMPRVIDGEQMGMVFNMAYGIQGESRYTHIPSMLEMLGIPYVGSTPAGHALALDKVMTKIVWQNHQLPTPDFWVFNSADDDFSKVHYPVIVKPKMESVSFGLKVVYNEEDLKEAVNFIVSEFQQQALVEQFIRGREFCVGLVGNNPVEAFPVLEIDLEGDPDAIQTVSDKKEKPRQKVCPANITPELADKMQKFSIDAFKALGLRDFARVDIRLDENDNIYLLEINSMASLGVSGSYPHAAKVAGYDYQKLVNRMLDVAAIRYFGALQPIEGQTGSKKLPLHSRLRTFIRSRNDQAESLLEKLVNINTHVRNVSGINQATNLIKTELAPLGFTQEVLPNLEVGNVTYFSNSFNEKLDWLLILSVDDQHKLEDQESFYATEHKLYGTGIWENKGGIVSTILALQALRFSRLIKKLKIGIIVVPDTTIGGKYSKEILNTKAESARHILALHGGNEEGSVITSRSGSANYTYDIKLVKNTSDNVPMVSSLFYKTLASIVDISKNNPDVVLAPYNTSFKTNIFKGFASGSSKISVRFNNREEYDVIDKKVNKFVTLTKQQSKLISCQLQGGISRLPMPETEESQHVYDIIKKLSKLTDTSLTKEHRWSSSNICNIVKNCAKVDGLGPMGGYDNKWAEYIYRSSVTDRALLLALLLNEKL
ncbi:ATP-grasp domain-containing protein [Carboxylicivirga sp. A043]|uniref:ATP-grasp domain-containing protein n=1 Tax=Carboxylicivirga litoralis TaxID=2816963 RepID=UPI0021CB745B|nr:ATP-grasp domain-containing protein [Carboxylicivirga sp. A043]MCU4155498.1 ATP-grasp domain-containing protein [Carboxylicivirga sp. A043]